jgi:hypothetical protein
MSDSKEGKSEILPEMSLLETINSTNLSDLLIDTGEVLVDQMLSESPFRDIPIIGSIVRIAKAGIDISNYLFIKKVMRFLFALREIPQSKRHKFIEQINEDEKLRKRVGENLFMLLHRLDDMQKPEMLSRVFGAYIQGVIDYLTYQKLATAIDRVNVYNLHCLIDFYKEDSKHKVADDHIMQNLAMAGLVNIMVVKGMHVGPLEGYTKNEIGNLFIKIVMVNEIQ